MCALMRKAAPKLCELTPCCQQGSLSLNHSRHEKFIAEYKLTESDSTVQLALRQAEISAVMIS